MKIKNIFFISMLTFFISFKIQAQTYDPSSPQDGCAPLTVKFIGPSGDWDFGDGTIVVGVANPTHTYLINGTFTTSYQLTPADPIIILNPPIVVYELPKVNAGKDQKICFNSSTKLIGNTTGGSGFNTLNWIPNSRLNGVDNLLTATTTNLNSTTRFILSVEDNNGCKGSDTVFVSINLLLALAGESVDVCNQTKFSPAPSVVGGHGAVNLFKYSWSPSSNILNANTTKPIITASNLTNSIQNNNVVFTVTDSVGCSVTSTFTYNVRPRFKFSGYTDIQQCLGTWTQTTGSVSNAQGNPSTFKYTWSPNLNIDNTFAANPSLMGLGKTIYKLKVIDDFNCADSMNITSNIYNPITLSAGPVATVCYNKTLKLKGSVGGGEAPLSYFWSPSSLVADTTLLTSETKPLGASDYIFLNVTDSKGCYRKDSLKTIVSIPTPSITKNLNVCSNNPLVISSSVTGGFAPFKYIWKKVKTTIKLGDDDGLLDSNVNDSISQVKFLPIEKFGDVIYSIEVKDKFNCFSPKLALDTIHVRPLPVLDSKNTYVFCFDDVTHMTLIADSGFVDYKWSTGGNTRKIEVSRQGDYIFTATDEFKCKASDTIHVVNKCSPRVFVPDAFSPNGDATNDVFKFFGRYYSNAYMKIFNRWGELIFIINDDNPTWDGTINGTPAPTGSYAYVMFYSSIIDGEVSQKQGVINLIR